MASIAACALEAVLDALADALADEEEAGDVGCDVDEPLLPQAARARPAAAPRAGNRRK